MDFLDIFTPPFTNDLNVLDVKGRICLTMLCQGQDRESIIKKLNGELDKKPNNGIFSIDANDSTQILFADKPVILIRGWGRLTGTGGMNLKEDIAAKLQDDFAKWIIDKLNN